MSHFKERKEKICLNCNAALYGRYCHVCGQENREPKETVWGLITHFFYDITHFDGKFFRDTGKLITRPGFLAKEYINGRRAGYINPIRFYIFSSAVFFIIFFSIFDTSDFGYTEIKKPADTKDSVSNTTLHTAKLVVLKNVDSFEDSLEVEKTFAGIQKDVDSANKKEDSVKIKKSKPGWNFSLDQSNYNSHEEYDSIQNSLPPKERDGWLKRYAVYRSINITNRYKDKRDELWKDLIEKFMHTFPYLLFVSLPLYAFYLKLLYIRRKKFYYVDHGIFLIYLYIFTFIFLLVYFAVDKTKATLDQPWMGFIEVALFIYGIYYAYKAMRRFYEQRRFKTILKFLLLNILAFISIIILFSLFFVVTVFRV